MPFITPNQLLPFLTKDERKGAPVMEMDGFEHYLYPANERWLFSNEPINIIEISAPNKKNGVVTMTFECKNLFYIIYKMDEPIDLDLLQRKENNNSL